LIIEIYTFAYFSREEAIYRMFKNDRASRKLLIEQYNFSLQNDNLYRLPHIQINLSKDYKKLILEKQIEFRR
jgi:predicted nuclease of restriction endonuclease-like RecB superfamily